MTFRSSARCTPPTTTTRPRFQIHHRPAQARSRSEPSIGVRGFKYGLGSVQRQPALSSWSSASPRTRPDTLRSSFGSTVSRPRAHSGVRVVASTRVNPLPYGRRGDWPCWQSRAAQRVRIDRSAEPVGVNVEYPADSRGLEPGFKLLRACLTGMQTIGPRSREHGSAETKEIEKPLRPGQRHHGALRPASDVSPPVGSSSGGVQVRSTGLPRPSTAKWDSHRQVEEEPFDAQCAARRPSLIAGLLKDLKRRGLMGRCDPGRLSARSLAEPRRSKPGTAKRQVHRS